MTVLRWAVAIALISLLLTIASLAVARPVSEEANPTNLRGAPAPYIVDLGDDDLEGFEDDLILGSRIGPVYLLPAAYDWAVWSLATLLLAGAYLLGRRTLRFLTSRPAAP